MSDGGVTSLRAEWRPIAQQNLPVPHEQPPPCPTQDQRSAGLFFLCGTSDSPQRTKTLLRFSKILWRGIVAICASMPVPATSPLATRYTCPHGCPNPFRFVSEKRTQWRDPAKDGEQDAQPHPSAGPPLLGRTSPDREGMSRLVVKPPREDADKICNLPAVCRDSDWSREQRSSGFGRPIAE